MNGYVKLLLVCVMGWRLWNLDIVMLFMETETLDRGAGKGDR